MLANSAVCLHYFVEIIVQKESFSQSKLYVHQRVTIISRNEWSIFLYARWTTDYIGHIKWKKRAVDYEKEDIREIFCRGLSDGFAE